MEELKTYNLKDMQIADQIEILTDMYGDEIASMPCLQLIIDYLFEEKAKPILKGQFVLYCIFFVLPFITQLFITDGPMIKICMTSCLLVQIFFLTIEALQMRFSGFVDYWTDSGNVIDQFMFLFFIIYYLLRQTYSYNGSYVIIPSITELGADFINLPITWFILVVMNVVLILQMIGKVCYFLKMYEKFGMLVQLIITCFQDVKPFTFFMIIWLVCFTLIFMLLGANNDVG